MAHESRYRPSRLRRTRHFPSEELYDLTSQIRCASVSISANIAKGCGRSVDADLAQFLKISSGSASELEYHLLLSHDLEGLKSKEY